MDSTPILIDWLRRWLAGTSTSVPALLRVKLRGTTQQAGTTCIFIAAIALMIDSIANVLRSRDIRQWRFAATAMYSDSFDGHFSRDVDCPSI
ncbi:MAG TPA: hypothetical protein VK979_07495 [Guyparkeria sp.]|nr:hypothetical protein [Guyparkeria sp.]